MGGGPPLARILVVDDEAAVCSLLSETLMAAGYECEARRSVDEALEYMASQRVDLVISDQRMPGRTGLELLQEVRRLYPSIAFMMITADSDIRLGVEAMKKGAADYLIKPFQLDAVLASLNRALEMKRMELELENYRQNLERMVEERTRQLEAARWRIEMTYDETLEALGAALDLRDTETAGHSLRVTRYCQEIARAMGINGDPLKQITRGAFLHDIGKIGVPDSILLKEGKLTPEEMAVMQSHARIGYDLVSRIAFLAAAAEIVLTHQERFDGAGYPQGLAGEEIPLGARIFAVADTLDAMTSDRPYRRALPFSAARAEVIRESGRQFDPKVVEAFLALPAEVWANIRLEVDGLRGNIRGPLSSVELRSGPTGASPQHE